MKQTKTSTFDISPETTETEKSDLENWFLSSTDKSELISEREPILYTHLRRAHWIIPICILAHTGFILSWMPVGENHIPNMWDLLLIIPFPFCLLSLWGFLQPFPTRYELPTGFNKRRYDRLFLLVCAKGQNHEAVNRTWNALKPLRDSRKRITLKILTDEGAQINPEWDVIQVPKDWTACQFAKNKARALEYFRISQRLNDSDWILHLDEESIVDTFTVDACINFIENTSYDIGQGIILYNQEYYWQANILCTVADQMRVADDIGRFHVQFAFAHKSLFGCHGSFLLTNIGVENRITWDKDSLTEDFFFAMDASQYGYTFGHVPGFCREQSPTNIMDLIKQRRRWFLGVYRSTRFPAVVSTLMWLGSCVATLYGLTRSIIGLGLMPFWLAILVSFVMSTFQWMYIIGSIMQDIDAGVSIWRGILHVVCVLLLQPLATVLQCVSVIYALLSPTKSFDIVKK